MKKLYLFALLVLPVVFCSVTIIHKKEFKDGVYKGESQSKYASEPYWGQVSLEIKNDTVKLLSFQIIDKKINEVFGSDYEQHFKDNAVYVDQCRNEIKGIKVYTEAFFKNKKIEKVDAITGATWSYNIFRDALNVTLEKARNK
jgi:major membrane immunogen (membrane-anchored lipoprotein)